MASTFSDLGIELMSTGENAGTWGDKTNTNLQIVEKAIAGYVEKSIAGGAQTTALSITDGTTTESDSIARHAVIKLTGSITGNQIVTVPDSIEKVYIITNGTSGAYTVQFKTASGTGITFGVSEKTTRLVYSDGTNLVDAGFGGSLDLEGRELVLDADGDTTITADTDDQIDIKIAGADDFQFTANTFTALSGSTIVAPTITASTAFVPDASDGAALGTSSLEFSDLFLADAAVINLGADQDVTLTHVADTGILLNAASVIQFRDSGLTIGSNADGDLDIISDGTAADSINIESAGGITLDAGTAGTGIVYEDDGTAMMDITNSSSDVIITTKVSDKDLLIKGNDGGAAVTALTFDMSAAGKATFNSDVVVGGDLTVSGDDIVMATNTAGNLLIADGTNFNSVAVGSLSEISTVANDDVFLAVDTSGGGLKKIARSTVVSGLATSAALTNVVEDTSPQLGGDLDTNSANILIDDAHFIADENGNEQIIFQTTSSAVNQFDVTNAATGNPPSIQATGGDSNIDFNLGAKGTGHVTILGNTNPGTIQFNCENNSHGQQIKAAAHSIGSSAVVTIPDLTGDMIVGKIGGTNFTNSLLIGHATTGTLNAALSNTGVGIDALDALTSGDSNTGIGARALSAVSLGVKNTSVGADSGKSLSSGSANTSLGFQNLYTNQGGNYNVAIGQLALEDATASSNTAVGTEALKEVSNSSYNIALGYQAGDNITTGSGNVIIGTVDAAAADSARTLKIAGYDGSTTTTWISGDNSGNLTFAGDVTVGDDLNLTTDSSVINFGADSDTTLTHTDGTGLTLNSTNKLCFNDATQFIQGASGTVLDIAATDEIELTATLIDVVGNLAGSGTGTFGGILKTDDTTEATSTTDGSLQTDGGLSVAKDGIFGDDVTLLSDAAVLKFGADAEVTLTHVHNDGLLLNADNQLQFRDSAINIRSDADGDLDINADDEVEINSTLIDVNGNVEISGTLAQAGIATFAVAANVTQTALTSSSNAVAWDASAKPNAVHVTTENTTFSAPSNAVEGAFIVLEINYNGSHTIAFNTVFEFAASTAPTTTDTDGKTDILVFRYNGAVWQEVGRTLNLSES